MRKAIIILVLGFLVALYSSVRADPVVTNWLFKFDINTLQVTASGNTYATNEVYIGNISQIFVTPAQYGTGTQADFDALNTNDVQAAIVACKTEQVGDLTDIDNQKLDAMRKCFNATLVEIGAVIGYTGVVTRAELLTEFLAE